MINQFKNFEQFLNYGQKQLEEAVSNYSKEGWEIDESENKDEIKLFLAHLIDPQEELVRIQRLSLVPNPDYNFDFYIEQRESEAKTPLPYLSNFSMLETKLNSKELTNAEKQQILNSVSYEVTHGKQPE